MLKNKTKPFFIRISFFIFLFSILTVFILSYTQTNVSALPQSEQVTETIDTKVATPADVQLINGGNCRYGVAATGGHNYSFINQLDAGWKVNFNVGFTIADKDSAVYVPSVTSPCGLAVVLLNVVGTPA